MQFLRYFKRNKILHALIKLTFSGLAIYFVYSSISLKNFGALIKNLDLKFFLLSLLFFNISKIISSFRLSQFYDCVGLPINNWQNLILYYLGMFYNLFLPGSIGGDVYKVYILKTSSTVELKKIISATLMDRISGVVIIVAFSLILLFIITLNLGMISLLFLFFLPLIFIIYYIVLKFFLKDFLFKFTYTNVLSLYVQIGQLVCAMFLLIGLGIHDSFEQYLILFLLSSLAAVLPISIGGLGIRELVFIYGYKFFDINKEISISFSFLFFMILATSSIPGVYFSLIHQFKNHKY